MQSSGLGLRVTTADLLVFDKNGLINNSLRFEDECVRHKTLDMIGDLALAGVDLYGDFEAYRTGHRLNAELVRQILYQYNLSHTLAECA
jgi:UDP-3-O-acyl-N-acetylglucosamine deacetylase